MEGTLSKWTNVVKGWQYRWFVLDDNTGLFSYYTSKNKMLRGVRRGCVRLQGAIIGIDDEDDSTFTITVDGKTFHFQAQDSQERERWIRALEDTIVKHNLSRRRITKVSKHSSTAVKIEDFDRKLSESDSYLQLLLNQVAILKEKANGRDISDDSREQYENVAAKATAMAESVKHAIILLQIAKNAAMPSPRSGGPRKPVSPQLTAAHKTNQTGLAADQGHDVGDDSRDSMSVSTTMSSPAVSPNLKFLQNTNLNHLKKSVIPPMSYSSSEDEDFFDAEDDYSIIEEGDLASIPPEQLPLSQLSMADGATVSINIQPTEIDEFISDDIDYDALYEEDNNDDEDLDMKKHGSVITHLLSQVRIGMDLTRIVLPTFILERRSLLEMYSDFFAHPDLVLAIPDGKTPEERMIRVLKWYLSSFHAGRKSSIAKKPYNPILGETFRCHWKNIENKEREIGDETSLPNPPKPWVPSENISPDDLTFVAEQVSHHPPISAFYAEHIKKRISVNAHIYTKSSFLGMSVAVHNLGQGSVTLHDLDEKYTATFPSGYGRSILTVPWIELGGKVSIHCPKTGYVSNLEFKCKPFFSSEVNKVTAEVFAPGSTKALLRVEGEWNGRMMAKYATGYHEVFMDVTKTATHKKICRQVALQEPMESRRLWKDVTHGLKVGDIESATTAKAFLEKRQREEAAQRKDSNLSWETKLFKQVGEDWFFVQPLANRLVQK